MVINTHVRFYPGHSEEELALLLDGIGGPEDQVWTRTGNFPPMRLDGALADHPRGGHGPIRYRTVGYEPGRSVTWRFHPKVGLDGIHRFDVVAAIDGDAPGMRHTIDAQPRHWMRIAWPLVVRWMHDACVREGLDQIEASLEGRKAAPRRHIWWARVLLAAQRVVTKEN